MTESSRQACLADRQCVPWQGGTPPLAAAQIAAYHREVPDWEVVENHHIPRTFKSDDFVQALDFTNRVGQLAEQQGHHPDVHLICGKAVVELSAHKIDGLSESDFVLAAKIDLAGKIDALPDACTARDGPADGPPARSPAPGARPTARPQVPGSAAGIFNLALDMPGPAG